MLGHLKSIEPALDEWHLRWGTCDRHAISRGGIRRTTALERSLPGNHIGATSWKDPVLREVVAAVLNDQSPIDGSGRPNWIRHNRNSNDRESSLAYRSDVDACASGRLWAFRAEPPFGDGANS